MHQAVNVSHHYRKGSHGIDQTAQQHASKVNHSKARASSPTPDREFTTESVLLKSKLTLSAHTLDPEGKTDPRIPRACDPTLAWDYRIA